MKHSHMNPKVSLFLVDRKSDFSYVPYLGVYNFLREWSLFCFSGHAVDFRCSANCMMNSRVHPSVFRVSLPSISGEISDVGFRGGFLHLFPQPSNWGFELYVLQTDSLYSHHGIQVIIPIRNYVEDVENLTDKGWWRKG